MRIIYLLFILISSFAFSKTVSEDRAHKIFESLVKSADKFTDIKVEDIIFMPDDRINDFGFAKSTGPYYELIVGKPALKNEGILAVIICHELGHIYSTLPDSEGMADYYAVRNCLLKNKLIAKKNIQKFLRQALEITRNKKISKKNYDHSECTSDLYDYPTKQQRFDTYMNALEGKEPPKSWYCI